MNTRELEYYLSINQNISKVQHEVTAADMLPKEKIENSPKMFIVNTCTTNVKDFSECHWICFHVKSSVIEYFDSSIISRYKITLATNVDIFVFVFYIMLDSK